MIHSFKRITRWAFLCSSLVGGAALAGAPLAQADCKPAHSFETLTPGVLAVAAWVFPPYSIPGPGNQLSGVDGEIIKRIAARECLEIKLTVVDPAAVIQSVIARRADVGIGDWYRTAERSKALGLSAPLYLDMMGIISSEGYSSISELEGKRIGTVQGYLWVDDLKKVFGDNLVLYPNPVAMAQDLASKRIALGVDSFAVGVASQQKGAYPGQHIKVSEPDPRVRATLQPGQSSFPHTKANTALGVALNDNIQALHASGEIAEILGAFGLDKQAANVGAPRLVE
ncbi:amino acid ABC transporter substrate-binding protein [Pseudomonas protegens]|uniref:Amino acid ABC transporter substrate-binding protein n=1 Tax=Pseudomonas protegens TaxID=380021 RepID=A0A7G8YMX1_9PSED|nr:transporter substrate-binding domain-containing protein [Pseudomonas protegens]QNH77020.1 amino acid ABC transporter substrate-binding protein [Pseudomonas protegens]QNL06215.1 amino acid ABC transporter substrate-binding protein [Pseudomonas protegens]